jgi:hypothetical protein
MLGKFPYQVPDFPALCETVNQATSPVGLKTLAADSTEPELLLGLAFLARAGSPARKEIAALALTAKPDYAPITAVLALALDGVNAERIDEITTCDPENALGHYLRGNLLHDSDRDTESLEAFRKAAGCSQLRLYQSTTAAALFKALIALHLQGRDRLCALCWMALRWSNFSGMGLQPLGNSLTELAGSYPARRQEISDLLLALAGHLYATDLHSRQFGTGALQAAFSLKAEVTAEVKTPQSGGYAAAGHALANAFMGWPGLDERLKTLNVVLHLPDRIHRAFAMIDPEKRNRLGEMNLNPTPEHRAAFQEAVEKAAKTAVALIEVVLTDPDGIVGPYLRGIPASQDQAGGPVAFRQSLVEDLIAARPDVFRAALTHEEAMNAVWKAGASDPEQRNLGRMMEIGLAIHRFAASHENIFPDNLDVLFGEGYLKPPLESKSILTGRPYVYVGQGQKRPAKHRELFDLVLLYDDHRHERGYYQCVFASCGGGLIAEDKLEQIKNRTAPPSSTLPPAVPTSASGHSQPVEAHSEVAAFLQRPKGEQGKILGGLRRQMMAGEDRSNIEFARTYRLAVHVRLRLEELESHPEEFTDFQSAFVQAVLELCDEEKVSRIRQIIRRTYEAAVAEKLDARSRPPDRASAEAWAVRRDAVDRRATREVEALLTREERDRFGRAFLGIVGIDLGLKDGAWHRFTVPGGGVAFPSQMQGHYPQPLLLGTVPEAFSGT